MALVDPKKKSEKFNPNVDNTEIASDANKGGMIITYISFILIIPLILYIVKRNSLVRTQMKINESSSGIDIQLKKRKDTLVKLVNAVKGEMKFEKETLKQITELRSNKKKSSQDVLNLTDQIASAINVSVEAYPDLKTSSLVQELMGTSTDIELEIAASRRLYNSYVNKFNSDIFVWPGSVIATNMQLRKLPLFVAGDQDRQDVAIDF